MYKKKIFGYVDDDRMSFLESVKENLIEKHHFKASKSKIIELGLIELEKNNDLIDIERKLLSNDMI